MSPGELLAGLLVLAIIGMAAFAIYSAIKSDDTWPHGG